MIHWLLVSERRAAACRSFCIRKLSRSNTVFSREIILCSRCVRELAFCYMRSNFARFALPSALVSWNYANWRGQFLFGTAIFVTSCPSFHQNIQWNRFSREIRTHPALVFDPNLMSLFQTAQGVHFWNHQSLLNQLTGWSCKNFRSIICKSRPGKNNNNYLKNLQQNPILYSRISQ